MEAAVKYLKEYPEGSTTPHKKRGLQNISESHSQLGNSQGTISLASQLAHTLGDGR